eukprot:1631080-Pyramimonas_sp.AAC.1
MAVGAHSRWPPLALQACCQWVMVAMTRALAGSGTTMFRAPLLSARRTPQCASTAGARRDLDGLASKSICMAISCARPSLPWLCTKGLRTGVRCPALPAVAVRETGPVPPEIVALPMARTKKYEGCRRPDGP